LPCLVWRLAQLLAPLSPDVPAEKRMEHSAG
jgi:hypothetical protein